MAFIHTVTQRVTTPGRTVNSEKAYSGDAQESRTIAIADSVTDQLVNLTLDVSQIKSVYMVSDQDITVETNDGTTPTDTINLKADVAVLWNADIGYSNPFTADVTALYLSNASGSAATFEMEIVHDATP